MLKKFPLYPILFSIFPVLSLAGYNIDEISLDVIPRPLFDLPLLEDLSYFGPEDDRNANQLVPNPCVHQS